MIRFGAFSLRNVVHQYLSFISHPIRSVGVKSRSLPGPLPSGEPRERVLHGIQEDPCEYCLTRSTFPITAVRHIYSYSAHIRLSIVKVLKPTWPSKCLGLSPAPFEGQTSPQAAKTGHLVFLYISHK